MGLQQGGEVGGVPRQVEGAQCVGCDFEETKEFEVLVLSRGLTEVDEQQSSPLRKIGFCHEFLMHHAAALVGMSLGARFYW